MIVSPLALVLSLAAVSPARAPMPARGGPSVTTVVTKMLARRGPLPGCSTYILITQFPASPHYTGTANFTVEYGEDVNDSCLSQGDPNSSSFAFTVNGVDRTSYFSVGGSQATATGVPLVDEATNTFVATIDGHDADGNPVQNSDIQYTAVDTTPAPNVYTTPYNADAQDMGRCAASCFWATYAQSTVPYFSLDAPRNVTLVYHGARLSPKPFINVDVEIPSGSSTPQELWLEAKVNGSFAYFVNNEPRLHFTGSAQRVRLAGQLRDSTLSSGVYPLQIIVTSKFASTVAATTIDTRLVVVNETNAAIARGWTLGGVQRLTMVGDTLALIADGDGSAVVFHKPGGYSSFSTPLGEFSALAVVVVGSDTTYVRTYPDSARVTFNNAGQMVRVADAFGNRDSILYDGNGRVAMIRDPIDSAITLAYNGNGLDSITDPMGRVTQVTVDGNRLLTAVADPGGGTTSFGYSGQRLTSITDRRGATTTLAYNANAGTLDSITAPAVTIYGEGSSVSPLTLLAAWQKVGVPYGSTSSPVTAPKADTVRATITDPGGHTTRFTANGFGQPLRTERDLGDTVIVTYNGNGQPITVVNRLGVNDSFTYDDSGFMTSQTSGGLTTNFRNGGWGRADSTWGVGVAQRIFIDNSQHGRVDSVRVGGVATTKYQDYDTRGRARQIFDAMGHLLRWLRYDGRHGNLSLDSAPGGQYATHTYDRYGRDSIVARAGFAADTIRFDLVNRVTRVANGVVPATTFGYDSLLLTSVTDPKGQVYGFAYNALGWLTSRTDPVSRSDSYAYSRDGELRRWTNRRGHNVDYTYDALHRLRIKSGDSTTTDSLTYSADARVLGAYSEVSTETTYLNSRLQPDSIRTVLQSANQTFWRRFRYTTAGLLDSMWASGGGLSFLTRRFSYTSARGTVDWFEVGGERTEFSFNGDLNATTVTFENGGLISRDYSSLHLRSHITGSSGFNATTERTVGLDAGGRIKAQSLTGNTVGNRYAYDQLGRLTRDSAFTTDDPSTCTPNEATGYLCVAEGTINWTVTTFSYDSVGNRRDLSGTYGTGNRITGFDGCSYATDYDGNVTSRSGCGSTVTFYWSAEGRLKALKVSGGDSLGFAHDAAGRLTRKDVNGSAARYFFWDGDNLLAELGSAATSKVAEYSYYGMDQLHAVIIAGSYYYAHREGLGNTIALTDASSNVARTYEYDAWGHLTGGTDYASLSDSDRVRWKGALWMGPEVELYYLRNRWYEPRSGRFISEDPIGLAGGPNPYGFAKNDPVDGRDPTGRCGIVGAAIGVGLYSLAVAIDNRQWSPGAAALAGVAGAVTCGLGLLWAEIPAAFTTAAGFESLAAMYEASVAATGFGLETAAVRMSPQSRRARTNGSGTAGGSTAARTGRARPGGGGGGGGSGAAGGLMGGDGNQQEGPAPVTCWMGEAVTIGPVNPGGPNTTWQTVRCDNGRTYVVTIHY